MHGLILAQAPCFLQAPAFWEHCPCPWPRTICFIALIIFKAYFCFDSEPHEERDFVLLTSTTLVRTGCVMCRAQCEMRTWALLFKNEVFQDGGARALNQARAREWALPSAPVISWSVGANSPVIALLSTDCGLSAEKQQDWGTGSLTC